MILFANLEALYKTFYERVKLGDKGAALRQQLADWGASEESVIKLEDLGKQPLPKRPLLALGEQPVISGGSIYNARLVWWGYDDPIQGFYRLRVLAGLLGRCYPWPDRTLSESGIGIGGLTIGAGPSGTDTKLKLLFRTVQLDIDC